MQVKTGVQHMEFEKKELEKKTIKNVLNTRIWTYDKNINNVLYKIFQT